MSEALRPPILTSTSHKMVSATPLRFASIPSLGTRSTAKPRPPRYASLRASACSVSSCDRPSSSTTSPASSQKKSTMKRPIGCWRRNFMPPRRRSRSIPQSSRSGTVASRRSRRAPAIMGCVVLRSVRCATYCPHPQPLSRGERGESPYPSPGGREDYFRLNGTIMARTRRPCSRSHWRRSS